MMLPQRFSRADVDIKKQETVFSGFFKMERYLLRHRLFKGGWSGDVQRELFVRGDAVGVLLYDPVRDAVALTQQFRIGCFENTTGPWVWEIVAGMMETGEVPENVAVREVAEETGLRINATQLHNICRYYNSPGGSSARMQLFCSLCQLDAVEGVFGLPEENEDIRVQTFSADDAFKAVLSGDINNAAAVIALQWLQMNRQRLQKESDK